MFSYRDHQQFEGILQFRGRKHVLSQVHSEYCRWWQNKQVCSEYSCWWQNVTQVKVITIVKPVSNSVRIRSQSCQIFVLASMGFEPIPLIHCSTIRLALCPAPQTTRPHPLPIYIYLLDTDIVLTPTTFLLLMKSFPVFLHTIKDKVPVLLAQNCHDAISPQHLTIWTSLSCMYN